MQEVKLNVPNISCGHCTMTIENAGKALAGVESINADVDTKEVDVVFDENTVSLDNIKKTLAEAGYPAR